MPLNPKALQFSMAANGAAMPVFFKPESGGNLHDVCGKRSLTDKRFKPGEMKLLCADGRYRTRYTYGIKLTRDYASGVWARLFGFIGPLPAHLAAELSDLMDQINRGISIKVNLDVTGSAYIKAVSAYPGDRLRELALATGACHGEEFTIDEDGHYLFSPVGCLAIPTVEQPEGWAQAALSACFGGGAQ